MEYRRAKIKNVDAVCGIVASAIAEMERNNIFQWDEHYPRRKDFLTDIENKQLFVGEEEDKIAVIFTVNSYYDDQYENGVWKYEGSEFRVIHRLCVAPEFQNRGIAKNTLEYIENKLRAEGVESIRLDVFCANPYALALYRGRGYETVGETEWRKGKFFLMEKKL